MRLSDYGFVFDGWQPEGFTVHDSAYWLVFHNSLPYVQFDAWTDRGYVTVRCDPCSLDQDRAAYAAMVRADLEKALRKASASSV
jgi:hypothetical protein